jgi:GH43 family beta-xylosidase
MSIHRIIKYSILITVVCIWSFAPVVAQGFSNPISPNSPEDFADPSVVYTNGYYYAVNSENGSSKIAVYKSQTLKNLYDSSSKTIVWVAPSGTDHSEAIWAPFLQYIQGNWYIYYTASWGGVVENHRMFTLMGNTQDPQGSYHEAGSIYATNTDFYAIDGKVIVKPTDGSLYFVWSGAALLPQQNIYIAPMADPTHISGLAVMISGDNASWENTVHESTDFIYKNGKSILSYSTGQLLNPGPAGYKTGTLTNTDGNYLTASSWVKSSGSVFQYYSGIDGQVYAPGATRFLKSPDGTEDWLVYHAKRYNDNNYNREIRAQKFTWDANNNPLFDHPIPSGVIMAVPSGEDSLPAEIISGRNYKIVARNSSLAATVKLSSTQPGALIEQRSFTGTDNQRWIITNLGNGYYKIIAKNSGLALAITNSSIDSGATLEQQTYAGQDNQQWKISNLGNGYYVISSKFSQKCIDVAGNVVTEGALINYWPFLGYYNQQWALVNLLETPIVTPTIGTYTYSGAAQGPNTATNTGTGTTYTYSYQNSGGTTYGPSATAPTNAGSYTVTATVAANGNYVSSSSSATAFSIAKATPIVTPVIGSYTYSGAPQGPNTATNTGIGITYTYSYVNYGGTTYGPSATAPTNLGSYTVTATVAANGNYGAANSSARAFSIGTAALNTVVYSENFENATVSGTILGKADAINYGGGAAWNFGLETTSKKITGLKSGYFNITNTGTDWWTLQYRIASRFAVKAGVQYKVTFTIKSSVATTIGFYAQVNANFSQNVKLKGGNAVEKFSITTTPMDSSGANPVFFWAFGKPGVPAQIWIDDIVIEEIKALSTPIVTPIIGTYTYSGAAQGPNTSTNTGTGAIYTYSYVNSDGASYGPSATAPTNAGNYTVTATVAANGNYGAASSSATAFSILTATPTLTVTPTGTYTYSGVAQGPNAITGNIGSGTVSWSFVGTGSTTYTASSTRPTNVGTYTATATVAANGNYGSASSSATAFSIGVTTPTVTPIIGTYTYTGTAQGSNAATNTGTGTTYIYSYVNSGGAAYGPSATPPTNAGNYTVIATVAANGNYGTASSSATAFSIATAILNTVVYAENFENATVGPTTLGNADAKNYGGGAAWTFGLDTNNIITGLQSGRFNITNTGTDYWTLQYRIDSRFAVKQGVQYKVTFSIQSAVATTIGFYAQVNANFSQNVNLKGGYAVEKFSITTAPMDSSGSNPCFFWAFGKPGIPAQIWIDDIVIEEITALSPPAVNRFMVPSVTKAFHVIAYPNPTQDIFRLEVHAPGKGMALDVQVYDMTGRLIEKRQAESNLVELGSNYPRGVYNVIVKQGENTKTLRVIKR